jgi:F-type H+-transporting ATPase subunit delta
LIIIYFSCFYIISCYNFQVDMVIVPATTGQMGVLPGHVATIAELKPGLLSVHEGSDVTKYFVSSGFAFIHANSVADVVAVEAVPLGNIDPNLVQKGLADFTQKLSSASTDLEKAEAQIGVDVHSTLNAALTG